MHFRFYQIDAKVWFYKIKTPQYNLVFLHIFTYFYILPHKKSRLAIRCKAALHIISSTTVLKNYCFGAEIKLGAFTGTPASTTFSFT
jgi:hypothetical protein